MKADITLRTTVKGSHYVITPDPRPEGLQGEWIPQWYLHHFSEYRQGAASDTCPHARPPTLMLPAVISDIPTLALDEHQSREYRRGSPKLCTCGGRSHQDPPQNRIPLQTEIRPATSRKGFFRRLASRLLGFRMRSRRVSLISLENSGIRITSESDIRKQPFGSMGQHSLI